MNPRVVMGARVLAVAFAACALFVAVQSVGTWQEPYAPNNWAFSHVILAEVAIETGSFPFNEQFVGESSFGSTRATYLAETGFPALSLYARTAWHFWNGIPLHPALVTGLALLTGLTPEQTVRVPVGAVAVVFMTYAMARRVVAHADPPADERFSILAPVLVAVASAPLALETRVMMPSVTLVFPAFLAFAMIRHAVAPDGRLLALATAPLLLLPFWYYTMAYFVIIVFGALVLAHVIARFARARVTPQVLYPLAPALVVPLLLVVALFATGTFESHLQLASVMSESGAGEDPAGGSDGPEPGVDYGTHLYRQAWRSAVLYAGGLVLASGLAFVGARVLARLARRERVDPVQGVVAQWILGAALFSGVIVAMTNVSFLNRTVIYMSPLAVVALVLVTAQAARGRGPRRSIGAAAAVVVVTFLLVVTPMFVYTATPRYHPGDTAAFEWMEDRVPQDARVYGPMEAVSPLMRAHGFTRGTAFHPTSGMVEDFWYGDDPEALVPYLASVEYVVLRADQRVNGFEDYSPARKPLPDAAFTKFAVSRDLQRSFDNGEVMLYRTALDPSRSRAGPAAS